MNGAIKIGAMLDIPVANLTDSYKDLIDMLTVDNPEYKNARIHGRGAQYGNIPKKLQFFSLNKDAKSIIVPRNISSRFINLSGCTIEDGLSYGRDIGEGMVAKFQFRPYQKQFFTNISNTIYNNKSIYNTNNRDVLLICPCGSGKTVLSLAVANMHKRKTLVCVTTNKLGKQFIKTVNDLFSNWSISWADSGIDTDIVVATYALLSQPTIGGEFFEQFGHIIFDEYHRVGASTYHTILAKAPCAYRTFLTATFRRKDGLHNILAHHCGEILKMDKKSAVSTIIPISTGATIDEELLRTVEKAQTRAERLSEYMYVCVKDAQGVEVDRGLITYIDKSGGSITVTIMSNAHKRDIQYASSIHKFYKIGSISSAAVDSEISELAKRNEDITRLLLQLVRSGRRVIVLSKRKSQLFLLASRASRFGVDSSVLVSSDDPTYKQYCSRRGMTPDENEEYALNNSSIIFGIDKLAEEGMDAPLYDTLVYLHPIRDVEQSIGRILREADGKRPPMGYYLIDSVTIYKNIFFGRDNAKSMFESLGHIVTEPMSFSEAISFTNKKDSTPCSM